MKEGRHPPTARLKGSLFFLFFGIALSLFSCRAILCQDKSSPAPLFREAAHQAELEFKHFIGATGEFFFPENVGSGVALLDYDNDGDLDVYLLQGALMGEQKKLKDSLFPLPSDDPPHNRLFRNQLREEGRLRFVDVTARAGVGDEGFAMGAAVGDYDNDGDPDLYVTNVGSNALYRNNGNGTFTETTVEAGVNDVRWSASSAFVDYDRDGDLDLFVTNYVDFTVRGNRECHNALGERVYCCPMTYNPLPDRLFRNEGKGSFSNVTEATGIMAAFGRGLGVACADFDSDGWMDIYVANDRDANQLWMNQGDGTFEDMALISATAYNVDGNPEASMGVTVGDFDNDGDEDLFISHLALETNTLYLNGGRGDFSDATRVWGLGSPSFSYTGWGTEWFDYDNDGDLDLFVANGAVYPEEAQRGEPYPYRQRNQLFRNEGEGKFRETTEKAGEALQLSEVSRAAAFGDIDNDGDIDIVIGNNNGRARLLLNEIGSQQHWLQVRLEGVKANRDGMGTRVGLFREGKRPLWRRSHTDGSYLSANDRRVHFGLGRDPEVGAVVVKWLGGKKEVWDDVRADCILTLREGSGKPYLETPSGAAGTTALRTLVK